MKQQAQSAHRAEVAMCMKQLEEDSGMKGEEGSILAARVTMMTREVADKVVAELREKAARRGEAMVGFSKARDQLKDKLEEQLGEREKQLAEVKKNKDELKAEVEVIRQGEREIAKIIQVKDQLMAELEASVARNQLKAELEVARIVAVRDRRKMAGIFQDMSVASKAF